MESTQRITVESMVNASAEKAWNIYHNPEHVVNWNAASPDWHSPSSENDVRVGGKFKHRMEAKDGSFGFDFEGEYSEVVPFENFSYTMPDQRKVDVQFTAEGDQTKVTVTFDPENENSHEMQRGGWQAILDNYARYAESV